MFKKRNLLIVAKLSIMLLVIGAVIITLVTGNREYFRGMVFAACIYHLALVVRSAETPPPPKEYGSFEEWYGSKH